MMTDKQDPLNCDLKDDRGSNLFYKIVFAGLMIFTVLVFLFAFTFSSGCVTMAKEIIIPTPTPTPTPEPTPPPTPTPTPTPEPTPDWTQCEMKDSCFQLRDWHHFFRQNVTGYMDLSAHATVYGYKVMPNYHYQDPLWGTTSYFKISPDPGNDFLFVFVNVYTDGDDVRQYGYGPHKFAVTIKDQIIYYEDYQHLTNRIKELDNTWNYAHVETIKPYPYKIIQEAGTGIISAEFQEWIMGGRSNAHDGYIIYQIPKGTDLNELRIAASFDNVGGNVFWKLV